MKKVRVHLSSRSYDILIGNDITHRIHALMPRHTPKKAFVVCDVKLIQARNLLKKSLRAHGWEVIEIPVAAGEKLKDFQNVFPLYGALLSSGAKRDSVLLALGGGSVGDAAGFVASTYLRGIPWIGLPTTLLAQVDSSIGGKTAVNHPKGKNLLGTFHQPAAVLCEIGFLATLSRRELISGLGEAVKYGIVFDPSFLKYIFENWENAVRGEPRVLSRIVERSASWKASIVSQDEFDKRGMREFLNFGHTFGHALETATRYKTFQHGEAVILGMRFALALSQVTGLLTAKKRAHIDLFLADIPVPPLPQRLTLNHLLKPFSHDKKMRRGKLHFVLLKDIGHPVSFSKATAEDFRKAFFLLRETRRPH